MLAILFVLVGPAVAAGPWVWMAARSGTPGATAPRVALGVVLGWGAGLGALSVVWFWLPFALGLGRAVTGVLDTALVLGVGVVGLWMARRRAGSPISGPTATPRGSWWWAVPFAVVAGLCAWALWGFVAREPLGYWDAWGIWNLRARFLALGGAAWRDGFSPDLPASHPDYPLLLPCSVVRTWTAAGTATPTAPVLLAALFLALTVGCLVTALHTLRGGGQGRLGGALLLLAPEVVSNAGKQYADIPLAFLMLATAVCFALFDRSGDLRMAVAAGLFAGLAAWTKNEGLLFLVAVALVRLPGLHRPRAWAREAAAVLVGAAPVLLTVAYFKTQVVVVTNDLVAAQATGETVARLTSAARHEEILAFIGTVLLRSAPFFVPVLVAYAILAGRWQPTRRWATPVGLVAVMAAGYYAVYLTTPYDLLWHLGSSFNRLFVQILPTALFGLLMAVPTPTDLARRATGRADPDAAN